MKGKRVIRSLLFLLPFMIGFAGYLLESVAPSDAAYSAFGLYLVSPSSDALNPLIEIARWTAPIALAGGFLMMVRHLWQRIRNWWILRYADASQLCGDSSRLEILQAALPHAVRTPEDTCYPRGRCIISFQQEAESFAFFRRHEAELRGHNVLICSDSIDMFRSDSNAYRIFNPTELIARDYWLSHPLPLDPGKPPQLTVVLIGFEALGEKLLSNAILNNIFHPQQHICYHVFGECALYRALHSDLMLMTDDRIVYHDEPWTEQIAILGTADRIIFSEKTPFRALQELQEFCGGKTEIHCRELEEELIPLMKRGRVSSFGWESEFLTEQMISSDRLYDAAKRLNYHYARLYDGAEGSGTDGEIEAEWEKLDSFTRHSNIASADYHRMLQRFFPDRLASPDFFLGELEHIRWSRFHTLYHWRPGAGSNGKKDAVNRLHPCLIPFGELSQKDKEKDVESIRALTQALGRKKENEHG